MPRGAKVRASDRVQCLPLARLRHADGRSECLFIGGDRKRLTHGLSDAFDPNRTLRTKAGTVVSSVKRDATVQ
jgi:hypothetical protein